MKVYTVEIAPKGQGFSLLRLFSSREKAVAYVESKETTERNPGITWESSYGIYLIDSYEVE